MTPLDRALIRHHAQLACVSIITAPAALDPLRPSAPRRSIGNHATRAALAIALFASICAGAAADAVFVSLFGVASQTSTPRHRPGAVAAANAPGRHAFQQSRQP